jgi:hypothetical protein
METTTGNIMRLSAPGEVVLAMTQFELTIIPLIALIALSIGWIALMLTAIEEHLRNRK